MQCKNRRLSIKSPDFHFDLFFRCFKQISSNISSFFEQQLAVNHLEKAQDRHAVMLVCLEVF